MNQLNLLMIKEGNSWTAQCLQYDIAAQGDTIRTAVCAFEFALIAEAGYAHSKGRSLDSLPAAPKYYWKKYDEAVRIENGKTRPMRIPQELASLVQTLVPAEREVRVF